MKNGFGLALLRTSIGRAWWLSVLVLLATTAAVQAADYTYTTNSDNTITITKYTGSGGAVVIPSTIDGKTVTSIDEAAFFTNASLTSVMIGSSVTNIGFGAFFACASLTAITVDALNAVYSSVAGVLFNKIQTKLIQYPGGIAGSYTIPNGVTRIEDLAFASCTGLTSVTIPSSVTSIGNFVFDSCASLTAITVDALNSVYSSVAGVLSNKIQTTLIQYPVGKAGNYTIPGSVTSIGNSAFYDCASLSGVTIPESVTSIGNGAFFLCTSLATVMIGNSVTSIGNGAFSGLFGLPNLTGVYFSGNAPSVGSNVFYNDNNATVYYLPGTTGWGPTFGGRPTVLWNPVITANGLGGNAYLDSGDTVTITVAINAGAYAGVPVDWWVIARAGSSWYYLNNLMQWTQFDGNLSHCRPVYQGGLFNLPATQVLNMGLPIGSYTFWFAVDYPMDGILNVGGQILVDSVSVTMR